MNELRIKCRSTRVTNAAVDLVFCVNVENGKKWAQMGDSRFKRRCRGVVGVGLSMEGFGFDFEPARVDCFTLDVTGVESVGVVSLIQRTPHSVSGGTKVRRIQDGTPLVLLSLFRDKTSEESKNASSGFFHQRPEPSFCRIFVRTKMRV